MCMLLRPGLPLLTTMMEASNSTGLITVSLEMKGKMTEVLLIIQHVVLYLVSIQLFQ
jgi:hypothetical protein